jgi:hypothetical protein
MKSMIVKFPAIITLNTLNRQKKLIKYIVIKITKSGKDLRLETLWKSPCIMRVIINHNQITFEASKTLNRGHPKITMNDLEREISNRLQSRKRQVHMLAFLKCLTSQGVQMRFITRNAKSRQ